MTTDTITQETPKKSGNLRLILLWIFIACFVFLFGALLFTGINSELKLRNSPAEVIDLQQLEQVCSATKVSFTEQQLKTMTRDEAFQNISKCNIILQDQFQRSFLSENNCPSVTNKFSSQQLQSMKIEDIHQLYSQCSKEFDANYKDDLIKRISNK